MSFDDGRLGSLSFRPVNLMAELVLQISGLSFQYECSRINLDILKLYVHLLGILRSLFFSPFFIIWVSGFP